MDDKWDLARQALGIEEDAIRADLDRRDAGAISIGDLFGHDDLMTLAKAVTLVAIVAGNLSVQGDRAGLEAANATLTYLKDMVVALAEHKGTI